MSLEYIEYVYYLKQNDKLDSCYENMINACIYLYICHMIIAGRNVWIIGIEYQLTDYQEL